jgi:hypothetical protein
MRRVWLVLLLTLLAACETCGDHVAELETTRGRVELDRDDQRGRFASAPVGERLWLGDGLRTGSDGRARLALEPEGVALVEPNTLMRFMREQPGQDHDRIALEEGAVQIDRAPLDLEVHTPRAIARLSLHGKLRVSASADGAERFDVLVGRVVIDHEGQSQALAEGQSLDLPGKGNVQAAAPAASTPPAPGPGPEGETTPAASAVQTAHTLAPGARAPVDLTLPGESAVIHVPVLPLNLSIPVSDCTQAPRVEVSGKGRPHAVSVAEGAREALVLLEAGTHRIRVRCAGVVRSDVRLRVQRDAATQELPRSAPEVAVDADGRNYTVHYQNVLPGLVFAWPRSVQASTYTLVLERGSRVRRLAAPGPSLTLEPGELAEGSYRFWFETERSERSAASNLRIVFDNTARSAYLSEPRLGAQSAGSSVTVAGAALARSEVSVGDQSLALDAQGRFRGEVTVLPGQESLAVRVRHPQAGLHYYLRRLR